MFYIDFAVVLCLIWEAFTYIPTSLFANHVLRYGAIRCMSCSYNSLTGRSRRTQINFTVLEIAPVSGAFATKDFTFVTKICLANKGIIFNSLVSYLKFTLNVT